VTVRGKQPAALLVVAPHPDDETIGAHALMTRMRRRGVAIRVVIVSDGAGSHRASATWPQRRLVRERRRESRLVLRRIGVTAAQIAFLDLPDGHLHRHAMAIRRRVAGIVRALPRPALVLAPSPSDAHPDHRVVSAAMRPQPQVAVRHYPVWPIGQHLRAAQPVRLTAQERLAKRHAIRSYRTQAGRITDDPHGFAMTARQIAAFSRPQEWFAVARR
jgi:LmbE family N-acetylglucosaminyl deacetylase